MPVIKLKSSDGKEFEVDVEIAKASGTIGMMLETLKEGDDEEVLTLERVNSFALDKVIQWATYHRYDRHPPDEEKSTYISAWDAELLNVDQDTLFDLILIFDYLDVKGLVNVACSTVANMLKNKTADEIRHTFNIENDMRVKRRKEN